VLGPQSPDPATDFFAIGGDSLRAARLFAQIEVSFGVALSVSTILEARTINELAALLRIKSSGAEAVPLVAVKPFGKKPPVFCIHNHTGDVLFCRDLPAFADSDQPIYGLQSRCVKAQPVHSSVEQMAADYTTALERVHDHGPCLLFGYSFGGLVAFEMAHLLIARGRSVAFLGMFNTPAPGSLSGWPLRKFSYLSRRTRNELAKLPSLGTLGQLRHLATSAAKFCRMVVRSATVDGWRVSTALLDQHAAKQIGQKLLKLDEINIAAAKNYFPTKVFPGQITFFRANGLPYLYSVSPRAGWGPLAAMGVENVDVRHDGPVPSTEEFASSIAAKLRACLEQLG
jgi:thioesterase domain-containing protein/acyl carrier protein